MPYTSRLLKMINFLICDMNSVRSTAGKLLTESSLIYLELPLVLNPESRTNPYEGSVAFSICEFPAQTRLGLLN